MTIYWTAFSVFLMEHLLHSKQVDAQELATKGDNGSLSKAKQQELVEVSVSFIAEEHDPSSHDEQVEMRMLRGRTFVEPQFDTTSEDDSKGTVSSSSDGDSDPPSDAPTFLEGRAVVGQDSGSNDGSFLESICSNLAARDGCSIYQKHLVCPSGNYEKQKFCEASALAYCQELFQPLSFFLTTEDQQECIHDCHAFVGMHQGENCCNLSCPPPLFLN